MYIGYGSAKLCMYNLLGTLHHSYLMMMLTTQRTHLCTECVLKKNKVKTSKKRFLTGKDSCTKVCTCRTLTNEYRHSTMSTCAFWWDVMFPISRLHFCKQGNFLSDISPMLFSLQRGELENYFDNGIKRCGYFLKHEKALLIIAFRFTYFNEVSIPYNKPPLSSRINLRCLLGLTYIGGRPKQARPNGWEDIRDCIML